MQGVDFFFSNRAHAVKFIDFLQSVVPIRYRHDKQLVSDPRGKVEAGQLIGQGWGRGPVRFLSLSVAPTRCRHAIATTSS